MRGSTYLLAAVIAPTSAVVYIDLHPMTEGDRIANPGFKIRARLSTGRLVY